MSAPPPEHETNYHFPASEDSDADVLMGNSITGLLEGVLERTPWSRSKSTWEPPTDEELKHLFPAYQIECLLGRGGMGMVYKAYDSVLRKTVAIKLLPPLLAEDAQLMARFKREAHVMNSLDHPGIVKVHSFVQTGDGHAYFVMDYVEGKTIHELVIAKEISVRKTLRLVGQICKALQYLHDKAIIHRDIKPSNIIVDLHGNARLLDFGIAGQLAKGTENLTLTGQNPGTPFYIAPELYRGEPPTASSDIYSLGVTFYEMLTGERPHVQAAPPSSRSSAGTSVDKVVFRALKAQPAARYQNADEMRKDIKRCSRASKEFRQAILIAASLLAVAAVAMAWILKPVKAITVKVPPPVVSQELPEPVPVKAPPPETKPQPSAQNAAAPASIPPPEHLAVPPASQPPLSPNKPDKENPFINSLGMKFVAVPGTHVLFSIWETRVRDLTPYRSQLDDHWIGKVSVPQHGDDPVVYVTRLRANDYCAWLTRTETASGLLPAGARYRLPTDLEWSAAAGLREEAGSTPRERSENGRSDIFPWGTGFPPEKAVGNYCDAVYQKEILTEPRTAIPHYDDGFATTSPVGTFPPNALGIYDMGGNVGEWCADDYAPDDKRCIIRGASYIDSDPANLRTTYRQAWSWETTSWIWLGFRCVLDTSGLQADSPKAVEPAPTPAILIKSSTPATPLEAFTAILHGYGWSYEDSRYPGSFERPPSPLFFHPNGKFHEKWKWNYWIAEPGVIHVQFWDPVYKPETAMALKFNEARTAYAGSFKDSKGKVHRITGTRLDPVK